MKRKIVITVMAMLLGAFVPWKSADAKTIENGTDVFTVKKALIQYMFGTIMDLERSQVTA